MQIFFILGILSATVLHDFIDGKLHDGLRAQYIFDTPDAGALRHLHASPHTCAVFNKCEVLLRWCAAAEATAVDC